MYVAFTRAEEKLFIGVPQKGKESFNARKVIYETLTNSPVLAESFDAQNYLYESGTLNGQVKKADKKSVYNSYKIDLMVSGNIFDETIIKSQFRYHPRENISNLKQSRHWGTIIHKALSEAKNSTNEEIERAVKKTIRWAFITALASINEAQKDELRQELKDILSNIRVKNWFDSENIMNESDIIIPQDNIFEKQKYIYRPDKVILESDKTVIIDFKTGVAREDDIVQIRGYGKILVDMVHKEIEMYLLYLQGSKKIQIEQVYLL